MGLLLGIYFWAAVALFRLGKFHWISINSSSKSKNSNILDAMVIA
jgi:hypothetical protein